MTRLRALLVAALFAFAWSGGTTQAAGAACAGRATARETLICSDPKLTAADEAVAAAYRAALAPLSLSAKHALGEAQQQWLAVTDTLCGTGGAEIPTARNDYEAPAACLARRYGQRQRQLDRATFAAGGRVIARIEQFAALPAPDRVNVAERDIAYPQIDQTRSEEERRWNAMIRETIEKMAQVKTNWPTDRTIDYRIASAGPHLISIVIIVYEYPHGAAHGTESVAASNWLLEEGRTLAAADLFARASWQDAIAQLAFTALQRRFEPAYPLFVKSADELREDVANPDRWVIEPAGLGLLFKEYEVGPYVLGHPEVTLPWSELRPFLAAHPPFDIPPR